MESIINIEDRLRVIKEIFRISVEAKVFPDDIHIYTIHQEWGATSNFRPEILSLSIDNPRHKKTIDIIFRLSVDIIVLFDQLKMFIGELGAEYKYKIDCKPRGGGLDQLYLVRWRWETESRDEFQFIDGAWWPYKRLSNYDNSGFVCTSPLFLIAFVTEINQFLKDRILIPNDPLPDMKKMDKLYPPVIKNEEVNYVLKNESVIIKLFEEYKDYFPGETLASWKSRWIDNNDTLPGIKIDKFQFGNNKHLLLTILFTAFQMLQAKKKPDYIKRRWGLKSYSSDASKYIRNTLKDPEHICHSEKTKIEGILKSE